MLVKTHYQTDQEELYKACGGVMSQLIEVETGVKSAASDLIGRDIIEKFRPDDNHFLQHLVAMGDGETYGYNKNMDNFSKQALERKHKTFETNAHVFREHRNKDAKTQGIGEVKYAAFDGSKNGMHRVEMLIWTDKKKGEEEYEMAKQGKELSYSMSCRVPFDKCSCCGNEAKSRKHYCFVPGTRITMADGTVKPIECVKVGDYVLDAEGDSVKVLKVFESQYDGDLVEIHNQMHGEKYNLQVTGNHPILMLPGEFGFMFGLYPPAFRGSTLTGVNLFLNRDLIQRNTTPPWDFLDSSKIERTDLLKAPHIRINTDLWNGFCDEEDAWVFGLFLAEGSFGKQNSKAKRSSIAFALHEDETDFVDRLRVWAKTRHNRDLKVYRCKNSKGINVRIHSTGLAEYVYRVFGEHVDGKRIPVTLMHAPASIRKALLDGFLAGDGCQYKDRSRVNSAGEVMLWQFKYLLMSLGYDTYIAFAMSSGGPTNRTNLRDQWYLTTSYPLTEASLHTGSRKTLKDYSVGIIRNISSVAYKGPVYNFATETHTYVANGIAVHNCDHMTETPGQYLPEFKKYAYVDNPDPTFFDISRVNRPADRIARYLEYKFPESDMQKAASDNQVILGVDWAEYNGLYVPEDISIMKYAGERLQLLEKLAYLEKQVSEIRSRKAAATSAKEAVIKQASAGTLGDGLTDSELNTLRALRPGTLFRELAKRACVMPFETFYRYVSNKTKDEIHSDPVFHKAAGMLPQILQQLMEGGIDTSLPGMFEPDSEFQCCTDPANTDEVQKLMNKADQEFGVCPSTSKPRIMKITIMNIGAGPHMKMASELPEESTLYAKALASSYAAYQIEALLDMQKLANIELNDETLLVPILDNCKIK